MNTKLFLTAFMAAALLQPIVVFSGETSTHGTDEESVNVVQEQATITHVPILAAEAGKSIMIEARATHDWHFQHLLLLYRNADATDYTAVEMKRTESGRYVATIPEDHVNGPGIQYLLASIDSEGREVAHFATRLAPHQVNIRGYSYVMRNEDRLQHWNGAHHTFRAWGLWTGYGSRYETIVRDEGKEARAKSNRYSDMSARVGVEYIHRPMEVSPRKDWGFGPVVDSAIVGFLEVLYDFRFGFEVMRARRSTVQQVPVAWDGPPGEQPGANHGYSELSLALHELLTVSGRLTLGADNEGFIMGGAGGVYVGRFTGTHLSAAYEQIMREGYRAKFRFQWDTVPHALMGLSLEMTDGPYQPRPTAANMAFDMRWRLLDRYTIGTKIGRTARAASLSSGMLLGIDLGIDL